MITNLVAVDSGLTVTGPNDVRVVMPEAVADIEIGPSALYKTIGTLVATPLVKVILVALPKLMAETVGL